MSFMLTGCDGFPGRSSVLLCNISLGDSRCGPIGCVLMLSSGSSIDCLDSWDVESAVLMVLIWCSINPFHLG